MPVRRSAFVWFFAVIPLAAALATVPALRVTDYEPLRARASVLARAQPQALERTALPAPLAALNDRRFEFYFTRAVYSSGLGRRRGGFRASWATDYPKADQQFLSVLGRLARVLDSYPGDHAMQLDDPELRRFPFLYAVEVGQMGLSEPEVLGLRNYLLAGGFLIVDDFWGEWEWENFQANIERVLPGYPIVDVPMSHPIFRSYYEIKEVVQVPNYGNACQGGPYHESGGITPMVRGIFDEKGRLMVLISFNSDLGDAWEWMELWCYPLNLSKYAYEFGVNMIVYAMSH
jgi:hypothetical protein